MNGLETLADRHLLGARGETAGRQAPTGLTGASGRGPAVHALCHREVTPVSVRAVTMFEESAFASEALRRHRVCPGGDEPHDPMVVAHHIVDSWAELVATGVAEELG